MAVHNRRCVVNCTVLYFLCCRCAVQSEAVRTVVTVVLPIYTGVLHKEETGAAVFAGQKRGSGRPGVQPTDQPGNLAAWHLQI